MKRNILSIICLLCIIASIAVPAYADSFKSNVGTVWFAADGKTMQNDFAAKSVTEELYKRLSTLQPGDDVTFTINLENRYSKPKSSTNWYMTSEIIRSLERVGATASGGGYEYDLKYIGKNSQVLYSSTTVGGDPTEKQTADEQGLIEVNKALKEDYEKDGVSYFFLDNFEPAQTGEIVLKIALDGETQGNSYQDRLADLRMNFAVQLVEPTGTTTPPRTAPKTGDSHNLIPYYIAMIISGLLFLYFALDAYTDKLYKKGRGRP